MGPESLIQSSFKFRDVDIVVCSRLVTNSCHQHDYLMPTCVSIIAGQIINDGILGNVDVSAFASFAPRA